MSYAAEVIADSIAYGVRITTFEITFPRFILAEFNTHRMFSRNSASSRAIPVQKRIKQVIDKPFVPELFAKNKSGMQAGAALEDEAAVIARREWLGASEAAYSYARALSEVGVHKQWANRLIEPFAWHTVVVTSTEWDNFWALRTSPNAQPEIQIVTRMMKEAYAASTPRALVAGAWHLPYVTAEDFVSTPGVAGQFDIDNLADGDAEYLKYERALLKVSVARCAAVSFERQDAEKTLEQLVERHDMLLHSGHMSPFEHQAQVVAPISTEELYDTTYRGATLRQQATDAPAWDAPFSMTWDAVKIGGGRFTDYHPGQFYCGNFRAPWLQYRKQLPGERVYTGA